MLSISVALYDIIVTTIAMVVLAILVHVLAVAYLATIKYRLDVSSNANVTTRALKVTAITASAPRALRPTHMRSVPTTRTASSLQDPTKGNAFLLQSVRTTRMISAMKPGLLFPVLGTRVPSVVPRPVPALSQQSVSKPRVLAVLVVDLRVSGLRGRTIEIVQPRFANLAQESVSSSTRATALLFPPMSRFYQFKSLPL